MTEAADVHMGIVFHLSSIVSFSVYHLIPSQCSIGSCFSRAISKYMYRIRPEMFKNTDSFGNL